MELLKVTFCALPVWSLGYLRMTSFEMRNYAEIAIEQVRRWMQRMGYDDFEFRDMRCTSDVLKGIRSVNANYPITQYISWQSNESYFENEFVIDSIPMAIGNGTQGQLGNVANESTKTWTKVSHDVVTGCGVFGVAATQACTFWRSQFGDVYAIGDGQGYGEKGTCDSLDSNSNNKEVLVTSLQLNVNSMACAHTHTFFITKDNALYACGQNLNGQLGRGDVTEFLPVAEVRVYDLSPSVKCIRNQVAKVACGMDHSVLVTKDHQVWTCGSNRLGQNGQGYYCPDSIVFCVVQSLKWEKVTAVAAGSSHSVAIGKRGSVFTWGFGLYGRLGHGNEKLVYVPTEVCDLFGISVVQVSCGLSHSVALTLEGKVFTFGDGRRGQLGHNRDTVEMSRPREVEALHSKWVVKVAAYHDRTVVLTKDGAVLHFGASMHGTKSDDDFLPVESPGLDNKVVVDIATGASHMAAVVLG